MTEVVFYRTSAVRPGTIRGPRQGAGRVHPPLPPWFRGGARWAGRQRTASPLVVGRDLVLEVALPRVGTVPPLRLPRLLAEATLVWVGEGAVLALELVLELLLEMPGVAAGIHLLTGRMSLVWLLLSAPPLSK